ncbi:enterochelin esterase [Marinomonas balearica]|uniref:Enterochelin esterase family protein n=1 Tax=Marinomonas balearica TaxID=491947 RepID=A0A4R6MH63_9GAMM|nr:enterochelin esterase [Marinomonas balearica]TDO99499.1 enterochelin esterase family protein [Marinomonas balearica]
MIAKDVGIQPDIDMEKLLEQEPMDWLDSTYVGSELWWRGLAKIGGPFQCSFSEPASSFNGKRRVDFFWRDPEGNQDESTIFQVLLDINSVTNHKSWEPTCLKRVKNTDVWHQCVYVDEKWRGSYSFIPLMQNQSSSVVYALSDGSSKAQRSWYLSIMDFAIADPLNTRPEIISNRGTSASMLIMNDAEVEMGWDQWDQRTLPPKKREDVFSFLWKSDLLKNTRRIWHIETHRSNESFSTSDRQKGVREKVPKPIVILLDGQRWTAPSGTPSVLSYLTEIGEIAPAHYLLIDSLDGETRWKELSCNITFWQAMFTELAVEAAHKVNLPSLESNVIIAGQSLGGLSAFYAGVHFETYVTKVISLSGSFWWPDVDRLVAHQSKESCLNELILGTPLGGPLEELQRGCIDVKHLELFISVGSGEGDMNLYNDILATSLQRKQARFTFERFSGGHDWLAWRFSLINGLRTLVPHNPSYQRV